MVIIPAYNEQDSIGLVVQEIPKDLVAEIIVCNNNSSDNTREVALGAGATVLNEERPGYGWACLKGMEYVSKLDVIPDIIVFLDGDYSDYPQQMYDVVRPIIEDDIDMVIGSRALGNREKGSMTFPQRFGNWLATFLTRIFYGAKFTDLGPFRAIKYNKLLELRMADKTYGWTIEMQLKAVRMKMSYTEVPVDYKNRIGVSKVSGTVKGVIGAGRKIMWAVFKYLRWK